MMVEDGTLPPPSKMDLNTPSPVEDGGGLGRGSESADAPSLTLPHELRLTGEGTQTMIVANLSNNPVFS